MSSKVVEANAGIHSLAMAVAVRPSPLLLLPSPSLNGSLCPHSFCLRKPLSSLSRAGACTVRDSFLRHQRLSFILIQFLI
jgi:hypothetical protein